MSFTVIRDAITHEECDRILSIANNQWTAADTQGESTARKSSIVWTEDRATYKTIFQLRSTLKKYAHYNITGAEPMQITKYEGSGFYDFHYDGDGITRINAPRTVLHNRVRKLSFSILLNDDYVGGEFEFYGNKTPISAEKGTLIAFPSYMMHRVTPITWGTRYSLVTWFVGEQFK